MTYKELILKDTYEWICLKEKNIKKIIDTIDINLKNENYIKKISDITNEKTIFYKKYEYENEKSIIITFNINIEKIEFNLTFQSGWQHLKIAKTYYRELVFNIKEDIENLIELINNLYSTNIKII